MAKKTINFLIVVMIAGLLAGLVAGRLELDCVDVHQDASLLPSIWLAQCVMAAWLGLTIWRIADSLKVQRRAPLGDCVAIAGIADDAIFPLAESMAKREGFDAGGEREEQSEASTGGQPTVKVLQGACGDRKQLP